LGSCTAIDSNIREGDRIEGCCLGGAYIACNRPSATDANECEISFSTLGGRTRSLCEKDSVIDSYIGIKVKAPPFERFPDWWLLVVFDKKISLVPSPVRSAFRALPVLEDS
jgi:hypothetical protein